MESTDDDVKRQRQRKNALSKRRQYQKLKEDPAAYRAALDRRNARRKARGTYAKQYKKLKDDPVRYRAMLDSKIGWKSASRKKEQDRPKWIVNDSRRADRLAGRENDLTVDFVATLIAKGCHYCEETTNLKMTLDRIDCALGHTKANVLPACIRCNFLKRDMPHQAWVFLVPRIKEANKLRLFGDWDGSLSGPKRQHEEYQAKRVQERRS